MFFHCSSVSWTSNLASLADLHCNTSHTYVHHTHAKGRLRHGNDNRRKEKELTFMAANEDEDEDEDEDDDDDDDDDEVMMGTIVMIAMTRRWQKGQTMHIKIMWVSKELGTQYCYWVSLNKIPGLSSRSEETPMEPLPLSKSIWYWISKAPIQKRLKPIHLTSESHGIAIRWSTWNTTFQV